MTVLSPRAANRVPASLVARSRSINRPPLVSWNHGRSITGKRAFDLALTLATMPVWLPILSALIAAVKISDPRNPAIFRHWRTGYQGRRFKVFKIRTMVPNAELLLKDIMAQNEVSGPQFKMRNDPRVTRIGRLLRKTCLDELPQLFNVLKGEMSLVGPRPCSACLDEYPDWWKARLMVKPGLTGRWQIDRHLCSDFDGRARLDIDYMRHRSMAQDISLLARTVVYAFVTRSGM